MRRSYILLMLIGSIAATGVLAYAYANWVYIGMLCILVMVLGVWGLFYSLGAICKSLSSYQWCKVEYRLFESKVIFMVSPKGTGHFDHYESHFTFEYKFGGKLYRRTPDKLNLNLTTNFPSAKQASRYIDEVRTGKYGNKILLDHCIHVPLDEMILGPPNLKVWAERRFEEEYGLGQGEERHYLIGAERASLTSDMQINVFTEWFDHSGRPLPEGQGKNEGGDSGLTGRLAKVTGANEISKAVETLLDPELYYARPAT